MLRLPLAAALALALPLALTACGGDSASAPGGVSDEEAKALDAAAEMLDARRLPPGALPTNAPTPEAMQDVQPTDPPANAAELTGDDPTQRN